MPNDPHIHACAEWEATGTCNDTCRCECGAMLAHRADVNLWAWRLPDGTWAPWPGIDRKIREAERALRDGGNDLPIAINPQHGDLVYVVSYGTPGWRVNLTINGCAMLASIEWARGMLDAEMVNPCIQTCLVVGNGRAKIIDKEWPRA